MTTALQMPVRTKASEQVGPRLFRKQVLPIGAIQHKDQVLRFDEPYLKQLVESFNAGAFDQVPFVLADEKNLHNEDPERFRGEVKALELASDGLDVVIEMSDKGAELLRENPRLGISARLVEDLVQADGRSFPAAMRHVCGTMDPVVTGLRDWETVSVRSLSHDGYSAQVIDLSASTYMADQTFTPDHLAKLNELSDEQRAQVSALLDGKEPAKPEAIPEADKPKLSGLKKLLGIKPDSEVSDDEIDSAIDKILAEENDEAKDEKPEPVALSAEDRKQIDLANERAAKAERSVAAANWKLERKEYVDAGVPPAMLELCEPLFSDGQAQVIDLSNGEKFDAAQAIRKLLDEAKGYVDLSKESGSAADEDEDGEKAKQRTKDVEALAEGWN